MIHHPVIILNVVGVGKLSLWFLSKIRNTFPLGALCFPSGSISTPALDFHTCGGLRDDLLGLDGRKYVALRLLSSSSLALGVLHRQMAFGKRSPRDLCQSGNRMFPLFSPFLEPSVLRLIFREVLRRKWFSMLSHV